MIPKQYGSSRVVSCPFCGKQGVTKNSQGVPVCINHKDRELNDLKCSCGEWLDVRSGKWGPFFVCLNCGNVSFSRGLELNPQIKDSFVKEEKKDVPPARREVTVSSDDLDFLF